MEDSYIALARQAIKKYLETNQKLSPPLELTQESTGVFVSLKTKSGELKGCIGTFLPVQNNLGLEIINNAISAATQDPRFMPVTIEEVDDLKISVDLLSKPEKTSRQELDPQKYGIIIKAEDGRSGLLLPDLEGVDTVENQINITCQKAGIDLEEDFNISRFTVERHEENKN